MSWMNSGYGIAPRRYAAMICEERDIGRRREIMNSVPMEMKQWVAHLVEDQLRRRETTKIALHGNVMERVKRCDKRQKSKR